MHRRKFLGNTAAAIAAAVVIPLRPPSAASNEPASHVITIENFTFSPAALAVRFGDRVTWINTDIVPHTATADDGSWDTDTLAFNEQREIVVTPGMLTSYFCRFHPHMTATLEII